MGTLVPCVEADVTLPLAVLLQGRVQRPHHGLNVVVVAVILSPETVQPVSVNELHKVRTVVVIFPLPVPDLDGAFGREPAVGTLGEIPDQLVMMAGDEAGL